MNNQPEIPKSKWVLEKVYFKARVVEDFKEKMIEYVSGQVSSKRMQRLVARDSFQDFCDRVQSKGTVEMYGFPMEIGLFCTDFQYYEKEDDNWVIPRELFVVLG